jgi:ABC-type transport system substrate-binding protein
MGMDITEPASLDLRFLCAGIGGLNFQSYCNHDLDPILEAADSTSDMAKRTELYFQAQKIINVDMPAIPLYVASNWWGTTKRVKGYDPDKSPGLGGLTVAQNWSVTQ